MDIEIKKSTKPIKYNDALTQLEARSKLVSKNEDKELIWILEHEPIFTAGTSYSKNDIIDKSINVYETNRGGKITYHGPGQLMFYFVIDLRNRKKDIRKFISIIEDSLITYLSKHNVIAKSFKDRVGIWVIKSDNTEFDKERKIGAIGLRISKWVTYHGLSFNINPEMKYYSNIHSCGLIGYKNTSLKELGINITKDEFDNEFKDIYFDKLANLSL